MLSKVSTSFLSVLAEKTEASKVLWMSWMSTAKKVQCKISFFLAFCVVGVSTVRPSEL